MTDRELYRQKKQAELDAWEAELDKFKAKASGATAEAQLTMNKHIRALQNKLEEAKTKLAAILDVRDAAWDAFQDDVEAAWDSLKTTFHASLTKLK